MSTETPRTDAADLIVPSDLTPEEQWRRNGQYVSADFARTLERELIAAQQEIERLRVELDDQIKWASHYASRAGRLEDALHRIAITDDVDCKIANDAKAMTKIARRALGEEG